MPVTWARDDAKGAREPLFWTVESTSFFVQEADARPVTSASKPEMTNRNEKTGEMEREECGFKMETPSPNDGFGFKAVTHACWVTP
jgi:hypothetical protein